MEGQGQGLVEVGAKKSLTKVGSRRVFVTGHPWERLDGNLLTLLQTTWSHLDFTWTISVDRKQLTCIL